MQPTPTARLPKELRIRTANLFFRLRNRQKKKKKLVRIRFGYGLDSRIYGTPLKKDENTRYLRLPPRMLLVWYVTRYMLVGGYRRSGPSSPTV